MKSVELAIYSFFQSFNRSNNNVYLLVVVGFSRSLTPWHTVLIAVRALAAPTTHTQSTLNVDTGMFLQKAKSTESKPDCAVCRGRIYPITRETAATEM